MKSFLKSILPTALVNIANYIRFVLFDGWARISYSQEGEDLILARIFHEKENGFYVDIGAHHPKKLSNTYFFYKKGWHGINIDAMPGSMEPFNRCRPRDINLEIAISNAEQDLRYYIFNEPALNTFSQQLSEMYQADTRWALRNIITIRTQSLKDVLPKYLPQNTKIDFMSIDVEGLDLAVLQSNDWEQYRPHVLLIEILGIELSRLSHTEIAVFLSSKGYQPFAKCINTVFFGDSSWIASQKSVLNLSEIQPNQNV